MNKQVNNNMKCHIKHQQPQSSQGHSEQQENSRGPTETMKWTCLILLITEVMTVYSGTYIIYIMAVEVSIITQLGTYNHTHTEGGSCNLTTTMVVNGSLGMRLACTGISYTCTRNVSDTIFEYLNIPIGKCKNLQTQTYEETMIVQGLA